MQIRQPVLRRSRWMSRPRTAAPSDNLVVACREAWSATIVRIQSGGPAMVGRASIPLLGGVPSLISDQLVVLASRLNLIEERAVEGLGSQVPDAVPLAWVTELGSQPASPSEAERYPNPKVFLAVGRGSRRAVEMAARSAPAGGAVRAVHVRKRIPTAMGPFYYETVEPAAVRLHAVMADLQACGVASISGAVAAAVFVWWPSGWSARRRRGARIRSWSAVRCEAAFSPRYWAQRPPGWTGCPAVR